jgi:hypothetical protein
MNNETENQTRLRRARESYDSCKDAESEARKYLAAAVEATRIAKERWGDLFLKEQNAECIRRKADYRHETK